MEQIARGGQAAVSALRTAGKEVLVIEGNDAAALRRGVGHIPGTSLRFSDLCLR